MARTNAPLDAAVNSFARRPAARQGCGPRAHRDRAGAGNPATQKRANALHNVLIPRYEEQVKLIGEALEEKDREDFFKVKQVKRRKHKEKSWTP